MNKLKNMMAGDLGLHLARSAEFGQLHLEDVEGGHSSVAA